MLLCGAIAFASALPAAAQDANQGPKKSPPEALALYADAASFQNNGAFDLAVVEWTSFLEKFPDDPLAAKSRYYRGVCRMQLKDYEPAVADFAEVLAKQPAFEHAEEAYLNLGWCQFTLAQGGKAELYDKAVETFQAMLKQFPKEKGKRTDQAWFFLGESLYAQGKKAEAVAAYDAVVKQHAESPLRGDALYVLGVTYEELGNHAAAAPVYDLFLKEFDESPLVTEVRMRKAETVLQAGLAAELSGNGDQAKALYAQAEKAMSEVAAVKGFAAADHAMSRQAVAVLKQGRPADAAAVYTRLATDFPQSSYAAAAAVSAGRCFYQAEKWDDASTWFRRVYESGVADAPEAAHWLCRILLAGKKPAEAAELAADALAKGGEGKFVVSLKLDRADALFDQPDRRAEAVEQYLKVAAEHPQDEQAPVALYQAAFTALDLKQYDAGLKHATAFLDTYGQHRLAPDAKYLAGECNLQLGQYGQALALYRDLVAAGSQNPRADEWRIRSALCLLLDKKYGEVAAGLGKEPGQFQDAAAKAEAHFLVGASQFQQGKFSEAAASLSASLAADAKWRQADETLLYLSRCQRAQDKTADAVATVNRLLTDFPQSQLLDQAHFRLGEYSYAAGDFAGAAASYEKVAAEWPNSTYVPYALYGKGWALLKADQDEKAIESFTALLTAHAAHELAPQAYLGRGIGRRKSSDAAGAVTDLKAFLATNPEGKPRSDARYELGLAQVALKDAPAAVESLTAILSDDPQYAAADKVLYELGWAYRAQDKNAEAVAAFQRLADEHGQSPLAGEANYHVGEADYDRGEYVAAVKSYALAKEKAGRGPVGERATYKLGWSYFQLKQYQEAFKQFGDQAATYADGPLIADALFMKGECQFQLANYAQALPAFLAVQKALDDDHKVSPEVEVLTLLHGGQAASQLKEWDQSLALLEPLTTRFEKSPYLAEAWYEIGFARYNLGKHDEAMAAYQKAVDGSRGAIGARARFMMGETLFAQKKHADAILQFQRVMFGFGGDDAQADVKTWQAKSGFEAGRCAEVQIEGTSDAAKRAELVADAIKFYTYVVEKHAQTKEAEEAGKRLAQLANLK